MLLSRSKCQTSRDWFRAYPVGKIQGVDRVSHREDSSASLSTRHRYTKRKSRVRSGRRGRRWTWPRRNEPEAIQRELSTQCDLLQFANQTFPPLVRFFCLCHVTLIRVIRAEAEPDWERDVELLDPSLDQNCTGSVLA